MEYIKLTEPKQLKSKAVFEQVEKLIYSGTKTNEILLKVNFICDEAKLNDEFRKLKNRIAFNRDNRE